MSVRLPSGVLAQFATNIELITNASTNTGGFTASGYRYMPEKEPESGMDGKYFISVQRITGREPKWGTGENLIDSVVTVQTSYYRGGGDMGGGDRQTVMRNAADDCQIIGDVLENPENYNSDVTGIRHINCTGSLKVHDLPHAEVWETTFEVQHRTDLDTGTVVTGTTSTGDGVSVVHISGEYTGTSVAGGDENIVGDPVVVNFDDFTWDTVQFRLTGYTKVSAGTGTFRVRIGGTIGTSGGTVVASMTETGTSYAANDGTGTAVTLPSGDQLLQVTLSNGTAGADTYIKGISIAMSDGAA